MTMTELSEQEMALVVAHRRAVRAAMQLDVVRLLGLAARFEAWKMEHGAGATYSTFCDDFGYDAQDGENRHTTYGKVQEIIESVYTLLSVDKAHYARKGE